MFFVEKKKEIEEYKVPKKPSHFDVYGNLVKGKEADKNYFNPFIFINQMSMDKRFLQYSIIFNSSKMDDEQIFECAKILAPKLGFKKFIKVDKKENLDDIMWYFKVNYETAKRYKNQLSDKELKEIKKLYNEI